MADVLDVVEMDLVSKLVDAIIQRMHDARPPVRQRVRLYVCE